VREWHKNNNGTLSQYSISQKITCISWFMAQKALFKYYFAHISLIYVKEMALKGQLEA
jgi:hypothetical protein